MLDDGLSQRVFTMRGELMRQVWMVAGLLLMACTKEKVEKKSDSEASSSKKTTRCPIAGVAQPTGGNAFGITSPASFTDACEQAER